MRLRWLPLVVSGLLLGCGEEESARGRGDWLIGTWRVGNPEEVAADQSRLIIKARSATQSEPSDGMEGFDTWLFPDGDSYSEEDVFKICVDALRTQKLEFSTGGGVRKIDVVGPMTGTWTVGSGCVDVRFPLGHVSGNKGALSQEFHMRMVRRGRTLVWEPPVRGDASTEVEFVKE